MSDGYDEDRPAVPLRIDIKKAPADTTEGFREPSEVHDVRAVFYQNVCRLGRDCYNLRHAIRKVRQLVPLHRCARI